MFASANREDEVPLNVGEMQRKLSTWATEDKERKFYDLYKLISNDEWLRLAHAYVSQNAGSKTAGCDGINMKTFDEELEGNLQQLREELKSKSFQPSPVRRVYIPKSGGKLRPLGIPSIKDRIVQEALRMVLEPIYEAEFSQYSFGFRPNRCTMDAIACITFSTIGKKRYYWVVEGDISSYFDTVNHRKLIKLLRNRIADENIIALIHSFLRAGLMEGKLFKDTKSGVPQGGIISPLLANIYLAELDKYMRDNYTGLPRQVKALRRRQGLANFVYVRYADDFVVLTNGTRIQAEELKEELKTFLGQELSLALSDEKTKVTHLNDGFKFLGFWVRRARSASGKMATKVTIPKESIDKACTKIRASTDKTTHLDSVHTKILALNRITNGWCNYYRYTSWASKQFHRVEYVLFWSMAHWLGRKYKLSMPGVLRKFHTKGNSLAIDGYRLKQPHEIKTVRYAKAYVKPNPYTTQKVILREELPIESSWTGFELRPGQADLRPVVFQRDDYTCQLCGKSECKLELDHIKPVRRFKRPVDANYPDNLWTLCVECHLAKTKSNR